MRRYMTAAATLAFASVATADIWSPMNSYLCLGNPTPGATQSPDEAWTFRRGAFDGALLTGIGGAVTCEPGFGLWGTQGGEYGFIPNVGPRLSPDEAFDEGTYDPQYPREFDGLMVIPGSSEDAFLVYTADSPVTIPPLTLKAEMVYSSSDGVLVSVKTRVGGVTSTWLDAAQVPTNIDGYAEWSLFKDGGPALQKGDKLWIQVNIKANISGDWTNISLRSGGCYADCTGDGTLDLFDFLCFVNAFNAGEAYADCEGTCAQDLFDFLCFVNQFNAGC